MATSMQSEILKALGQVYDPDLKKDLVTLNMIQDLQVSPQGEVHFRVVLTTPACPLKEKLKNDCEQAVQTVPGVTKISIQMDAQVRRKTSTTSPGCLPIPGVSHIIAVSSGKGGVGKSTISTCLAIALAQQGAAVGLLDADIYGPNTPTMMGIDQMPKIENDIFQPPIAHQVRVMSMGFLIKDDQPLVWRGPMLHSVIQQFCYQVNWGTLDYLIVDLPPGTGDVQLSLAQLVPLSGVLMVSTAQEVAMQDARKAFHMFQQVRIPILGVVENMSYFICDQCDKKHSIFQSPGALSGGQRLAQKCQTQLLAQIPLMSQIVEQGDLGSPIVTQTNSTSPATLAVINSFRELASKVAQRISILSQDESHAPAIQIGSFS